jgi:hypothetical protein
VEEWNLFWEDEWNGVLEEGEKGSLLFALVLLGFFECVSMESRRYWDRGKECENKK